jgi:hypothetical protein
VKQQADQGNASILMMGVLALSFSWVLALVTVEQRLTTALSAQTVADATALAAVQSGEVVAQQLVALNGARIVSLEVQKSGDEGATVVVVIELDGVQAQATASNTN